MHIIDWIIISGYLIGFIFIIYKSYVSKQTMKSFAIDKQSMPTLLVAATLSASFIGPGYTIGLSEHGYNFGLFSFFVFLGFSIQTILVGQFIAPKLRKYKGAFTVGDIIGFHYGKLARIITGIISVLFGAGLVGVVALASGNLLNNVFEIEPEIGIIVSTLIVVLYSFIGGMRTVVFTDIFQFLMLSIAMSILLFAIFTNVDSIESITANLPETSFTFFSTKSKTDFLGMFLGFLLGETLVPPYTNRAFVSKNSKNAQKGFLIAGIYSIIWCIMVIGVGVSAKALHPEILAENSFLHMVNTYMPIGFLGLMTVAIISIIMSTQDSFLNSASVSFVRDILNTFNETISSKKALLFSKLITILIGILGVVFAVNAEGIIDALMINYTLWAPTIVMPLIIAVLMPNKVKPIAGLIAIFAGGISVIIWEWILNKPNEIPSLLIGIIFNQLFFWFFQIFASKRQNSKILLSSSGCKQIENIN